MELIWVFDLLFLICRKKWSRWWILL